MTGRRTRDEIDARLEDVRRSLRARHAGIEPDPQFARRVIARLPLDETWSFDWAVRRILPVSIGVAVVLTIAVVMTGGSASRTAVSATTAATAATSQTVNDPLEWLLESRQELR